NASGNRVSISAATVIWLARRFVSTSSSGGVFLSECALVSASVRLHGARPWHPPESSAAFSFVAASVRLHGARPWHLQEVSRVSFFCSGEREPPRRKAVASPRKVRGFFF